jgi:hypothetical protein
MLSNLELTAGRLPNVDTRIGSFFGEVLVITSFKVAKTAAAFIVDAVHSGKRIV